MTFALKRTKGVAKPSGLGGRSIIVVSLEKILKFITCCGHLSRFLACSYLPMEIIMFILSWGCLCAILKVIPDATIAT